MIIKLSLVLQLAFTFGVGTQAQDAQPDRWRGLVLDTTTPDEAIAALGKPAKDKAQTKKGVALRSLEFKKPTGFNKAILQFTEGNLSTIILISPAEKIPADNLPTIYGFDFDVRVSGLQSGAFPEKYERNQGKIYPKTFPAVYELYASDGKSLIEVTVGNSSFGSVFKDLAGVQDVSGKLPGKVLTVTMRSLALTKSQGADALK